MRPGVSYEIVSASTLAEVSEDNPQILAYALAEQVTGRKIVFEQIGGATKPMRGFAEKGATVIMHSGTGEGMPTARICGLAVGRAARIQIEYLKSLANA